MRNKRELCAVAEPAKLRPVDWKRLAELAKIPDTQREWWCEKLAWRIERACANRRSGLVPSHAYAGPVAKPIDNIVNLARQLQSALTYLIEESDDHACEANPWLDFELRRAIYLQTGHVEDDCIEQYRAHIDTLISSGLKAAANVRQHFPRQGRKRGIEHGDPLLKNFVAMVAMDTLRAGGKLTVNKGGSTGTLVDLLEALRPHLPVKFLPHYDYPATSTYSRILARVEQEWERGGSKRRANS